MFIKTLFKCLFILLLFFSCSRSTPQLIAQNQTESSEFLTWSKIFLEKLKANENVEKIVNQISSIHPDSLQRALNSPQKKKAFWINIYNGYIQYSLQKDAAQYEDRSAFFSSRNIKIATELLSFDDIEHGILRASTWKYSLGYLQNPLPSEFVKKFRMDKTDERLHFALNCGAESCPPIEIYSSENFDDQINSVAHYFLKQVSNFDEEKNEVYTTPLFSWFRGDFDGNSGIRETLIKYSVLPKNSDADLEYNEYDWTLRLGNYYVEK